MSLKPNSGEASSGVVLSESCGNLRANINYAKLGNSAKFPWGVGLKVKRMA
jgi:hypothetical protein